MRAEAVPYDDRYLAGIVLFNRHDFFEAHEVWEALWLHGAGTDKRFIQGLIQAAVGLVHFGNGNVRGAAKLYQSARAYMERYGPQHMGLDSAAFWRQMEVCFAPVLAGETGEGRPELDLELVPEIALDPPPAHWPDPAEFVDQE